MFQQNKIHSQHKKALAEIAFSKGLRTPILLQFHIFLKLIADFLNTLVHAAVIGETELFCYLYLRVSCK